MLYLNKNDIETILENNYDKLIESIEKAIEIYETNDYVMPDRISIVKDDETYLYMPCFSNQVKGTKILTLYPNNSKINQPTIQGIMMLNNLETGKIDCILDGASITAYRTGAVSACGIKYTTPDDIEHLGIIGCGEQAYYQCLMATKIRPIKTVYLYDVNKDNIYKTKEKIEENLPNIQVIICKDSCDLIESSQLIITVTTSKIPVIPDDENLLVNKHFIGVGSYKPEMQEYSDAIYKLVDEIYIDVDFAKEESGDLVHPIKNSLFNEENIFSLGKVLAGHKVNKKQTTFYKSVGMALFDVMVADVLYNEAKNKRIGQNIIE